MEKGLIRSKTDTPSKWQVFFLPKDDQVHPSSVVAFCPFTKIYADGSDVNEATRNWINAAKKQYQRKFFIPKYSVTSRKIWYSKGGNASATTSQLSASWPSASMSAADKPLSNSDPMSLGESASALSNSSGSSASAPAATPYSSIGEAASAQQEIHGSAGSESPVNNVFVIDFNFSDYCVAFCPQTRQLRTGNWDLFESDQLHQFPGGDEFAKMIPGGLFDCRVQCTQLMELSPVSSSEEAEEATENVAAEKPAKLSAATATLTPHCIN